MSRKLCVQIFKYLVYALLVINVYVFFSEEWRAAAVRFEGTIALGSIIEGFVASIDTAGWVVLLLLFELETSILSARQLSRQMTSAIHWLRIVCYALIVYAFYGYVAKLIYLQGAVALPGITDLCNLADMHWSYAIDLDEYLLLTIENCSALMNTAALYQLPGLRVVVFESGYIDIVRLAWVDVINAGVWLLVVIMLEADVHLHGKRAFNEKITKISAVVKFILYSTLLGAALYWGFKGDFIDFWDAFLWLVAFVFIELNVFGWHREPDFAPVRV